MIPAFAKDVLHVGPAPMGLLGGAQGMGALVGATYSIVGRVSHGTAHLPSSQSYHLMAHGIGEAATILGFETPSDFVRAYPVSRE